MEQPENPPIQQVNNIPAAPPPPIVKCSCCQSSLKPDTRAVRCAKFHSYCQICGSIDQILQLALVGEKFKCYVCSEHFELENLDNILTQEQREKLDQVLLYQAMKSVDEASGEGLTGCPFCTYMEIRDTKSAECLVFACKNEGCKKASCLVCHKEWKAGDDSHIACLEIQDVKKEVETVIEQGSKRLCPKCGYGGVKDEACSHIACPKCEAYYCYICRELAGDDGFDQHNYQWWEAESTGCPMYLYQAQEHDERWPACEEECIEFLHNKLVLIGLIEVVKKYRAARQIDLLRKVEETYHFFDQYGWNIDTIEMEDAVILKREVPPPPPPPSKVEVQTPPPVPINEPAIPLPPPLPFISPPQRAEIQEMPIFASIMQPLPMLIRASSAS